MGREYAKMGIPMWCEIWLEIHNDAMHDYPREQCRECQRAIQEHGAMPPKWRMSQVYKNLKRPERKSSIPVGLRRQVLERDNYTCQECGATERLSIDHIVAEVWGGETAIDNLQVLCMSCNLRKSDK